MKNKNNIFFHTKDVYIVYYATQYYRDWSGGNPDRLITKTGEFNQFIFNFPIYKKDLKTEAEKALKTYGIRYDKLLRIEYNEYAGKKKGMKKITIKF